MITLAAVGREARREGHAGEVAQHALPAGCQVEQIHPRPVVGVAHERDLVARRMEARRQHQPGAVGQEAVVLAVLVHDRQPLGAPVARAGGGDVDDAGVEIALLAQQPLIDHVGHDVGDAAPVALRRGVGGALDLRLRQHVPQAELDADLAAALRLGTLPVTSAWAPVGRQFWKFGIAPWAAPDWMNAARRSGRNSPQSPRSLVMTRAMSRPSCADAPSAPPGRGWRSGSARCARG